MEKNDFERCAALREWRLTHAGGLPNRTSDNDVEKSLACWLSKALQRTHSALGVSPSERQLTPDQAAHLNSIVGMAIGQASANAPVSESSDTAAAIPVAVSSGPCQVVQQILCQMWLPSVSVPRRQTLVVAMPSHCVCGLSTFSGLFSQLILMREKLEEVREYI